MVVIELTSGDLREHKDREWFLPTARGGYSCSTVLGRNTQDYHGFLVSPPSGSDFKREILVSNLKEGVSLPPQEERFLYQGLKKFTWDPREVKFYFSNDLIDVKKRIEPFSGYEGLKVTYELENKVSSNLQFAINLVLPSGRENFKLWNEHTLGFKLRDSYLLLFSDYARCFENLPAEEQEGFSVPARFLLTLREGEEREIRLIAFRCASEEAALQEFKKIELKPEEERQEKMLSSGLGIPILALLSATSSFLVERGSKLGVITGYPFYGDQGRDTMISLPGLTLISSNFKSAELIFERFLNKATSQGVPGSWVNGEPKYEDNLDTNLWLVDRLYQYMAYIEPEKFKPFLHTYWWNLKDSFRSYSKKGKDGLLKDTGKTWMSELKRGGAVEIQGLWYNYLKIMEKFSDLMDDHSPEDNFSLYAREHEESFMENFWEGSYLRDSLEDALFRPNQIILLSLDFGVVPPNLAKKILLKAREELLTPYGLRTLSKEAAGYDPGSKFNGGVWPWLLGPFVKAYLKFFPQEQKEGYNFIKTLFESEIMDHCLGSIAEFFHSETYEPRGNISHASSVAELLRTYFEDILGRKGVQKSDKRYFVNNK